MRPASLSLRSMRIIPSNDVRLLAPHSHSAHRECLPRSLSERLALPAIVQKVLIHTNMAPASHVKKSFSERNVMKCLTVGPRKVMIPSNLQALQGGSQRALAHSVVNVCRDRIRRPSLYFISRSSQKAPVIFRIQAQSDPPLATSPKRISRWNGPSGRSRMNS